MEIALRTSFSVVLLIGTVPSGHDSPDSAHSWKLFATVSVVLRPFGLSGESCRTEDFYYLTESIVIQKTIFINIQIPSLVEFLFLFEYQ